MEAKGRNVGFGFPGYDGHFPKAMRSSRGREGVKKNKELKDMRFFEMLATVAGQILQDEGKDKVPDGSLRSDYDVKSEAGSVAEKGAAGNQSGTFSVNWLQTSHIGAHDDKSMSKGAEDLSGTVTVRKAILGKDPDSHLCQVKEVLPQSSSCRKGKDWGDRSYNDSMTDSCHEGQEDKAVNLDILSRKATENEGITEQRHTILSELNQFAASLQADVTSNDLGLRFMGKMGNSVGKEKADLDQEVFPSVITQGNEIDLLMQDHLMTDDDSPQLVCSGSSEEALPFIERKSCETTVLQMERWVKGEDLTCSQESNDDKDSFESKTAQRKPSRVSYRKASKARRRVNSTTNSRVQVPRPKRKRHEMEDKVTSVASSPTISSPSSKLPAKKSGEARVKLTIKSFTVPELLVDLPESATVSNLKSSVMEAAINLLGGGFCMRVLLQGKKTVDETASLLQVGISRGGKPESLSFMLEPNPIPTSTSAEDPLLMLSCAARRPASRYPILSKESKSKSGVHPGTTNEMMKTDVNGAETKRQAPTMSMNKDDSSMFICDSGGAIVPCSQAVVLHASKADDGLQELALVPLGQKSENTEIQKRRMRRPFTVAEVEALVQAVEKLGTGRWRDVKLDAFAQAKHRTYVDLKDKWKTLVHTAHIAPHQRRGEPVPQGLLDRVIQTHSYWTALQVKQQADLSLEASTS